MQPTSIQLSLSQAKADPSIAWARLYIIYIEPLLMMMRRMTKGLAVSLVQQRDEDYCDDVNFIGERESDLIVIEAIFSNF